ncbi:MAG: alkaline phosphatase [Lachnospiraceae bacterium]|nr:alkaline phosphatase [Lachnospiraceae bacterium]
MKRIWKRIGAAVLAGAMLFSGAYAGMVKLADNTKTAKAAAAEGTVVVPEGTNVPKYVFLFIGDGMSYPQIQLASDYLGALAQEDSNKSSAILEGNEYLNFMNFEAAGSAVTYDSTSFCPDSASTATSLSTGYKTYSGTINMDETKTISYETITEKVKDQLGYKVGIVTTVNLNHATPAAFYAKVASRSQYYDISLQMIESDFDYFAGGALLQPEGKNGDQKNIYEVAEEAGYQVIDNQYDAKRLTSEDGKTIVIGQFLADSDSLDYDLDRASNVWSLADYVAKGIEVLDNETGFFMMVEGGKIDWACHANDAGSTISDTLALADAVEEAIEFYNEHPDETLIIVTGDHETGGLTIGYAGTNYDTFLTNLENQKISYAKYDSEYVAKYKANNTPFETVLKDIKKLFGLMTADDADAQKDSKLVLTDYEVSLLREAYNKTMGYVKKESTQKEYVMYGTYEPLSVTITHILNNKSGVNFSSYSHTGLPVAVLAQGEGAELFDGYYDNTEIYDNLAALLKVE